MQFLTDSAYIVIFLKKFNIENVTKEWPWRILLNGLWQWLLKASPPSGVFMGVEETTEKTKVKRMSEGRLVLTH